MVIFPRDLHGQSKLERRAERALPSGMNRNDPRSRYLASRQFVDPRARGRSWGRVGPASRWDARPRRSWWATCLAGYQAGDRPIASSARKQTELTSAFRGPHMIRKDFQITRYTEDVWDRQSRRSTSLKIVTTPAYAVSRPSLDRATNKNE